MSTRNLTSLKTLQGIKNWDTVHGANNAEFAFNTFQGTLGLALKITCPLKKTTNKTTKNLLKYFDDEAKALKDYYVKAMLKLKLQET